MSAYSVNQQPVSVLLGWIDSGNVAIPEMQRPFVWTSQKVRDLLDSLYRGFPVGYLITWQSQHVPVRGGGTAGFNQILIDGQQRMTALRAALAGHEVVDKDYRRKRIAIAFNPRTERFETLTPVYRRNPEWINDVHEFMVQDDVFTAVDRYMDENPEADRSHIGRSFQKLYGIKSAQIGIISLSQTLDIETVTEIFVRINSKGVPLSSADFVMSKMSAYGEQGRNLRKLIDYFAHLIRVPSGYEILKNDVEFAHTPYWQAISWLKDENEDFYDPGYIDIIRVAAMVGFQRGRISAVVGELSGLNPETRKLDPELIPVAFNKLEKALGRVVRKYDFQQFVMTLKSTGFIDRSLLTSTNAVNFSYALFLILREQQISDPEVRRITRRWFVMMMLTGRSSGSFETVFESDLERISRRGAAAVLQEIEDAELSDSFWTHGLPQALTSSSINNPQFRTFLAAQVKQGARGFLSLHTSVQAMVEGRGDIHHLVPKEYLRAQGIRETRDYNQVANYALTETAVNIRISKRSPEDYMGEVRRQIQDGQASLGEILHEADLDANLAANAVPRTLESTTSESYEEFLSARRRLMADYLRDYYTAL